MFVIEGGGFWATDTDFNCFGINYGYIRNYRYRLKFFELDMSQFVQRRVFFCFVLGEGRRSRGRRRRVGWVLLRNGKGGAHPRRWGGQYVKGPGGHPGKADYSIWGAEIPNNCCARRKALAVGILVATIRVIGVNMCM